MVRAHLYSCAVIVMLYIHNFSQSSPTAYHFYAIVQISHRLKRQKASPLRLEYNTVLLRVLKTKVIINTFAAQEDKILRGDS